MALVPFAHLSERLEARLRQLFKPSADFWRPDMFEFLQHLEAFFPKLARLLVVVASFSQTRAPKGAKGKRSQKVGWPDRKEFTECDLRCAQISAREFQFAKRQKRNGFILSSTIDAQQRQSLLQVSGCLSVVATSKFNLRQDGPVLAQAVLGLKRFDQRESLTGDLVRPIEVAAYQF